MLAFFWTCHVNTFSPWCRKQKSALIPARNSKWRLGRRWYVCKANRSWKCGCGRRLWLFPEKVGHTAKMLHGGSAFCKRIISCETIHSHWQCHEPLSLTCPAGTKTYIVHPSTFKHIFISFFFLGCLCPFCILCFRCIVTFANFTCSLFSFLLLFSI